MRMCAKLGTMPGVKKGELSLPVIRITRNENEP